ncbi:MAG: trigger factor [bacterium]
MKILEQKRKENIIKLKIEVSHEEIDEQRQPAFKKISKNALVPGFRKGKAPIELFIQHFGEAQLIQEATLAAINEAYFKAIKEKDIDVVDYPKNIDIAEYKKEKPLTFSCEVDVKPIIKLGKYKGIKVQKELKKVEPKTIENELKKLQENSSSYKQVDRPIKDKDLVVADVVCKENDTIYAAWTKENFAIQIGQEFFGKDLDKTLIGSKNKENKKTTISYPKDYKNKEIANKKLDFDITIKEIKEKELPELTDEFIQKNSQFKTLKELKEKIQENLSTQYEQECENKLKTDVIDSIINPLKIQIPDALLAKEKQYELQQYESILKQSGLSLKQYLTLTKKNEEEILKEMLPTIEKRIKTELALEEVAKQEKIEATEEDQLIEIKKANPKIRTDEEAKKLLPRLDISRLNFHIKQIKAVQFLLDHAKIS